MKIRIAFVMLALLAPASASGEEAGPPAFSQAQAERGQEAYVHSCVMCHGEALDDGDFGGAPLRGSWFRQHWGEGDVSALFDYIKTAMPPDNPGSLTDRNYADIVGFILLRNGYAAGSTDLPADDDALQKMTLKR